VLGAIPATVVALVLSAGLGRRPRFYDPAVTEGKILLARELQVALAAARGDASFRAAGRGARPTTFPALA